MIYNDEFAMRVIEDSRPVAYHSYSSSTIKRLVSYSVLDGEISLSTYNAARGILTSRFQHNNLRAFEDNKVVFEVELYGAHFFIGFFDFYLSIGLGVAAW